MNPIRNNITIRTLENESYTTSNCGNYNGRNRMYNSGDCGQQIDRNINIVINMSTRLTVHYRVPFLFQQNVEIVEN